MMVFWRVFGWFIFTFIFILHFWQTSNVHFDDLYKLHGFGKSLFLLVPRPQKCCGSQLFLGEKRKDLQLFVSSRSIWTISKSCHVGIEFILNGVFAADFVFNLASCNLFLFENNIWNYDCWLHKLTNKNYYGTEEVVVKPSTSIFKEWMIMLHILLRSQLYQGKRWGVLIIQAQLCHWEVI